MNMIEKVARAIALQQGANWDAKDFTETLGGEEPYEMVSGFEDIAKAAIQAMREPSEEIIEAMKDNIGPLAEMWRGGIDAALTEK